MNIGTIFVVIVFSTLFTYIGWVVVKRLLDYFFADNILRITTIKQDGQEIVETYDLDKLSVEQINQLRERLAYTMKKGACSANE